MLKKQGVFYKNGYNFMVQNDDTEQAKIESNIIERANDLAELEQILENQGCLSQRKEI